MMDKTRVVQAVDIDDCGAQYLLIPQAIDLKLLLESWNIREMTKAVGMFLCEPLSHCVCSFQNSPAGMGTSELRVPHPQNKISAHLPVAGSNTVSQLGLCPSGGELVVPVGSLLFCFPLE